MRLHRGTIALLISAAALALPMAGCAGSGVAYEPYRQDYYRWSPVEDRYYRQWEFSTHRQHQDFQRRSARDRQAYWNWRHH